MIEGKLKKAVKAFTDIVESIEALEFYQTFFRIIPVKLMIEDARNSSRYVDF